MTVHWLGLALGLLGGTAFFAALRAETALLVEARGPALAASLALHAARLVAVVVALTLLARSAPSGLVPALVGLTASGLIAARRAACQARP